MKVEEIMSAPVYVVSPEESVARARHLMLRHRIGRLIIVEGTRPVGIVTKKDISRRLGQDEPLWRRRPIGVIPVRNVMTESVITIFPDATPKQLAELMIENNISGIPVVNNKNEVLGIVTKWDLIRYFSEQPLELKVKDINIETALTVHRHHTICHILYELEANSTDRVVVTGDSGKPVGIITSSNLTFTIMQNKTGDLPQKGIKMTRKESYAGRKMYRYVRDMPLVAEDIMSSPLITVNKEDPAVYAAGIMVKERIRGLPVVDNGIMGILTGDNIIKSIMTLELKE